jgi:hypothetical protein
LPCPCGTAVLVLFTKEIDDFLCYNSMARL